jgi:hypothetical protein
MKKQFTLEEVREIIAHLQSFNSYYFTGKHSHFSCTDKWTETFPLDEDEKNMVDSLYGQIMAALESALGENDLKLKGTRSVVSNIIKTTVDKYFVNSNNCVQALINGEHGWTPGNLYQVSNLLGIPDLSKQE